VPAFFPSHSTTKFCDRVTFRAPRHRLFPSRTLEVRAESPEDWMQLLVRHSIQDAYEAVSARLFAMIGEAIPVATNGFSHRRLAA
jgi:hypothetical protein